MEKTLRVAGFLDNSLSNGQGLRSVLFLSGCIHNCPGCQNKEMQDFNYGDIVPINDILGRIQDNLPLIKGVTLSGGDPLEQAENLIPLLLELKKYNLNIWCYTGYTLEEIQTVNNKYWNELLELIDVLVDGKFEIDNTENTPRYIGSNNQKIIQLKNL